MEAVHRDADYQCEECDFIALNREELKSHVHRDGDFNMMGAQKKIGSRVASVPLDSRSARRVPQLAALALYTAGSTAQASQFAQSWFFFQYFIWIQYFLS